MRLFTLILMSLLAAPAFAQEVLGQRDRYVRQDCTPTPSKAAASYPGKTAIIPYNNLAQPTGKPIAAEGQQLYLYGRVFDKNCVPLKDAVVDIWQTNPFGAIVKPSKSELALPDPTFAGSGRAYTDSNGEFFFLTLYPGPRKGRAPKIHAYVTHPETRSLRTSFYFAGDHRNDEESSYKRLSETQRKKLSIEVIPRKDKNNALQGSFDIILNGTNNYREF